MTVTSHAKHSKEHFSTTPVLSMPDMTKPFILEMDASKWAIGGPQFTSNIFNGILDAIGIKHRMSERCLSPSNRWTN